MFKITANDDDDADGLSFQILKVLTKSCAKLASGSLISPNLLYNVREISQCVYPVFVNQLSIADFTGVHPEDDSTLVHVARRLPEHMCTKCDFSNFPPNCLTVVSP